jgi:ethanolamine ammonia-lyase small subunit
VTDEVERASEVSADPWRALRELTPARIGLGRAGAGLPTTRHLEFQLAHARARDAVQARLDFPALTQGIADIGLAVVPARAGAADLATHLRRPDLGRRLDPRDAALFVREDPAPDLAIVVAGGLSATAVNRQAVPVLAALRRHIASFWRLGPVALIEHGRVAIGDDVAERLGAQMAVVLIGERPGLSAPDSLGIYTTWAPRVGTTDEARHCISNVRPEGLPPPEAARLLADLLADARRERCTGVALNARLQARPTPVPLEAEVRPAPDPRESGP